MRARLAALTLLVLAAACPRSPRAPLASVAGRPGPPSARAAAPEKVAFSSRDADLTGAAPTRLSALLFRPSGPGPFPAVIALHGCAGLYRTSGAIAVRDLDWANRLRERGYVVLLPDSFTPRGVSTICRQRPRTIRPGIERARDAYAALAYLQSQPFVRRDRVGLLGWSNGAIAVLSTLDQTSQARPSGLAHDFRIGIAFYPACTWLANQGGWRPVAKITILVGESDDWTPAPPCLRLAEQTRAHPLPLDVVVYPGAYHDFDYPEDGLRTLGGLPTTASGRATVGADPGARANARQLVPQLLDRYLR